MLKWYLGGNNNVATNELISELMFPVVEELPAQIKAQIVYIVWRLQSNWKYVERLYWRTSGQ